MSINITMPALSPTMEEGTLAKWHVKEGDSVSAGDVIAEIETDKATMEVEAVDEGTIGKILVGEGSEGVKVNAVIAVLLEDGESAGDIGEAKPAPAPKPAAEAPAPAKAEAPKPAPAAPAPQPVSAPTPAPVSNGARVFASPLARRLAKEAGIDIARINGTGPKGRVVKADVERAKTDGNNLKAAPAAAMGAATPAVSRVSVEAIYEEGSYQVVPADGMRKTVAARLTEAARDVPHFFLTADIKLDALMKARADINATAKKDKDGKPEFKLSVNDFVLKAWAIALQQVPEANATWAGDAILLHKHSDVAVAVAVPGGLFTPVVKQAELKSLRQISAEVKDLATRAKSKKLAPHEYVGGSSAVSNLGMFGVKHFTSIINPPHGTIISIGAGEERVYVENGEIRIGTFMTISVSCDHRSVDGALGAQLMAAFKALIEQPVMMLA
ncbi:MAG: pyruvate dehydrogenase complex dihydrolipoamide acetyltransferase [Hyphomicrobiaceae bacterium]|nr:pyruvate dehydrogenase complex dihydrolipoamide acetyltransferase [Hyphomicrobiaceae bacterium]